MEAEIGLGTRPPDNYPPLGNRLVCSTVSSILLLLSLFTIPFHFHLSFVTDHFI